MRANLPRYRTEDEEVEWRKLDAVARFEQKLETEYGFTRAALDAIRAEVEAELGRRQGVRRREPRADPGGPRGRGVRAALPAAGAASSPPARELTFAEAIKEALAQEMERDPRVFVLGEDVGKIGGIFAATRGLIEKFGPERRARHADLGGGDRGLRRGRGDHRACGRWPRCRSSTSSRT